MVTLVFIVDVQNKLELDFEERGILSRLSPELRLRTSNSVVMPLFLNVMTPISPLSTPNDPGHPSLEVGRLHHRVHRHVG